ncbi:MAG TPA: hypothetical protein VF228_07665 [Iamia sp.]
MWRRPISLGRATIALVVVLALAELGMRAIDDHLPRATAGDTIEIELKYAQLQALHDQGEPVDLVVLGNSTLDAGIDPVLLGEESARFDAPYNAALLGQPLASIRRWAGEFVLEEVDPDTVVLGLTPLDVPTLSIFGVSKPAVESAFSASFDALHPDALQRAEDNVSEHSALVRRRAAFRAPGELWRGITDTIYGREKAFEGDGPVTLEDGRQGVRDRRTWEQELLGPRGTNRTYWGYSYDGTTESRISPTERRAYERANLDRLQLAGVIGGIRDAGVDDIVVVLPPHDLPALEQSGVPLASYHRLADDLVAFAQDEDLAVIDLSDVAWEHADFYDPAHLSKQGAERLTRLLAEELDQL